MFHRLFSVGLALLPFTASAAAPVTWVGVDYGLVHMVGTGDFRDPSAIFPGYLDKWNVLFHGFGFRNYWFGTVKETLKTLHRRDVP